VTTEHEPQLLVDRGDGVTTLTLNRPDRLNALTTTLRRLLAAALADAAADERCRVVILTGAGRGFCAGQDLADLDPESDIATLVRDQYTPIINQLVSIQKPVIGAINGACVGAGLGLALACDQLIASTAAVFSCAFVGIALVPDSGVSSLLVATVGYQRAFELAVTGRRVDAGEALRLGIVLETTEPETLQRRVGEHAATLAAGPTRALGMTKTLLRDAQHAPLTTILDREASLQGVAAASADHREGLDAFLAKRRPVFHGH
jgi:2-(1,2-epoxy-1,2-dihydrophenyl)acetyl-CoA isomerase